MDFSNLNRPQLTLMGSAFCVVLSLHFTLQLVSQHLFYWKNPKEQKAILIIILMAPLYAVVSFVGLLDIKGSKAFFMFLESVKECYEALVIAKFMALMYSYLNISISKNVVPDEFKGREIHHSFPMTLFQPRTVRLNHNTLKLLKYWTWQFVVIRPVCSVLMITLQLLQFYPSWLSWTFTIILNVSVSLALYSLVAFYHVFAKELEPHKPLAKFMCIKGIVFFCFWQGVVLDILVAVGFIKSHHFWLDVEHLEEAIQNVLVCLEMVVFAVLQQYAYHVYPYSGDVEAKLKLGKKNEWFWDSRVLTSNWKTEKMFVPVELEHNFMNAYNLIQWRNETYHPSNKKTAPEEQSCLWTLDYRYKSSTFYASCTSVLN